MTNSNFWSASFHRDICWHRDGLSADEIRDRNPVTPLSWGQMCTARSGAGAPHTGQGSFLQLPVASLPALWEARFAQSLWLPLSSHWTVTRKNKNSKTAQLKMKYAVASGYAFPLLGSTAMIIVSTKRNYSSGRKKKSNPLFARTHHKPLLVIIGAHCATV